jgi:hypothetical protein
MAIPAKKKPGTEADDPSARNHDLGDGDPASAEAIVTRWPESIGLNCASGEDEVEMAWRRHDEWRR